MKHLFRFSLLAVLLLVLAPRGWAQDPGTAACRKAQLAAQAAVAAGAPYRNHGALVSTASAVTSPLLEAGLITEACESCIINQFARRIPIADQTACGPDGPGPRPECEPATCDTFIPCEDDGTCGQPVCVSTTEGDGFCVEGNTPCAGLATCADSSDCAAGEVCATATCCGINVCIPAGAFCPEPAP